MMAQDPAFLFYPGDYLRDTQCLSEKAQVAYDRIMCEHMRNICISQDRLEFFTKRLTDGEKQELAHVLTKTSDGYAITWVAESICKRKNYSASRRKNREGKPKKDINNTSSTYDSHMENEIENANEDENKDEIGADSKFLVPQMLRIYKTAVPNYPDDRQRDSKALLSIAQFLCQRGNLRGAPEYNHEPVLEAWEQVAAVIGADRFYCQKSLSTVSNHIQEIIQKALHGDKSKPTPTGKGSGKFNDDNLKAGIRARVDERRRQQSQAGAG